MTKDWQAVAEAISSRLSELDMTQAELAQRSEVALETVRELQHNLRVRRRSPRTLAALSKALRWPEGYLVNIAESGGPAVSSSVSVEQVLVELAEIRSVLLAITTRLDGIESRLPEQAALP